MSRSASRRRKELPPPDLSELEEQLHVRFRDPELLVAALSHRSHHTVQSGAPDNERLEFLGDAVLELSITTLLFQMARDRDEGWLTQLRSLLVRQDSLARLAVHLGIPKHLRLGRGERQAGGAMRPSLNANCMEAILGAIYLDQSFDVAFGVVKRLFGRRIRYALTKVSAKDAKSQLQELSLARYNALPKYVMVKETGSDHNRRFHIKVVLKNQLEATGAGRSKKAAEQLAAAAALKRLITPT